MSKKLTLAVAGKDIAVEISNRAERMLSARNKPLMVEMELYFSCLIRKRVRFYDDAVDGEFISATGKLSVGFRTVMTQQCGVHDFDGPPPLTDFEIKKPEHFIPHWLRIDYREGEWRGEFGYC